MASLLLYSCGADPVVGEIKYVVQITQSGEGRVKGLGAFEPNQSVTLTAVPDTLKGYVFDSWIKLPEEIVLSHDATFTFEIDDYKHFKVVFVIPPTEEEI